VRLSRKKAIVATCLACVCMNAVVKYCSTMLFLREPTVKLPIPHTAGPQTGMVLQSGHGCMQCPHFTRAAYDWIQFNVHNFPLTFRALLVRAENGTSRCSDCVPCVRRLSMAWWRCSYHPQHFLNLLPEPQGHATLRPNFGRGPAGASAVLVTLRAGVAP
jgi:hypothetical protein